MGRRAGTVLLLLAGLMVAGPAAAAQKKEGPNAPVRVLLMLGRIQQGGPAYAGRPVALEVQVRNVGQAACGQCRVQVRGGGLAASQALPPLRSGEAAKVSVGGLVFRRPGKYLLAVVVDAPPGQVDFGGKRPGTTFELTVLEGSPAQKGPAR